jgi:hypothetical protein
LLVDAIRQVSPIRQIAGEPCLAVDSIQTENKALAILGAPWACLGLEKLKLPLELPNEQRVFN